MIEIRALHARDDRSTFRSGNPDLDRFLQQFAGQNQFRHHIGVTYVAVDDGRPARVVGFATVAAADVEIDDLPAAVRGKLPRYPLPVLRLARLAVDRSVQGRGIGLELVRFVCRLAVRMADDYGCVGVIVDAKPEAVAFYTKYGFTAVDVLEGQSNVRPAPTPMFLPIRAIRDALGDRA